MTIRSWLPWAALSLPLAVAACGSDTGTTGAMGQSSTSPTCAPNDAVCQTDGLDAPLAEGARLPIDVHVTAKGVAAPKLALESARAEVIGLENGVLVGKGAGFASVLMVADGVVVDFVTMTVERPERVEVYRLGKDGAAEASPLPAKIQLAPGDDFELTPKAFSGATRLLGELDATWTLDGTAATLLDGGRAGARRIRAKSPGIARLTVKTSSFEKTLEMEVLP